MTEATNLIRSLHTSLKAINDYNHEINNPQNQKPLGKLSQTTITQLVRSLVETQHELNEIKSELSTTNIISIETPILKAVEQAIEMMMADTDDRVTMLYNAMFSNCDPFNKVLTDIQDLIGTIEVLKNTRGKRTAETESFEGS